LVTLILICEMMTKAPVKASATFGDENTYWKAIKYICVGSAAFDGGTRCLMARKARKETASSFSTPRKIQPGPADRYAVHHPNPRASRGGRKRKKSTCSPICATSENTTVDAAPNSSRLNACPSRPAAPENCVHSANALESETPM